MVFRIGTQWRGYPALIICDTLNVCELVKSKSLTKQFQNLRHIYMWLNIETLEILTKGSITSMSRKSKALMKVVPAS